MLLRFCEWAFGLLYPVYLAGFSVARDHDPDDREMMYLHAAMRRSGWPGTPDLMIYRKDQHNGQFVVARVRVARWRVWRQDFCHWMFTRTKNRWWMRYWYAANREAGRTFGMKV